jgi:hypothetical protein
MSETETSRNENGDFLMPASRFPDICCIKSTSLNPNANSSRRPPSASLKNVRQIRAYQIAALQHAVCIALWAIAVELFFPLYHVCLAAVGCNPIALTGCCRLAGAISRMSATYQQGLLTLQRKRTGGFRPSVVHCKSCDPCREARGSCNTPA